MSIIYATNRFYVVDLSLQALLHRSPSVWPTTDIWLEKEKKSINDAVKLQKPRSQFFEKYIINELQDIGLNYQFGKTNKKGSIQITVVVVW